MMPVIQDHRFDLDADQFELLPWALGAFWPSLMTAFFLAAPGGTFAIENAFDTRLLDVAVGLDILSAGGVNVKLSYDGRFSEHSDLHSGGVKAALPF